MGKAFERDTFTNTKNMAAYADMLISEIKDIVQDKEVILALSGGVDSSVTAVLIQRAIGDKLHCIFVDHGLMRKKEPEEVMEIYKSLNLNVTKVDASERFLTKLEGVSDPEEKRKIIGEEFIRVFEEESKALGRVDFLAQGTIYPDIIESGKGAELVKSHHNVGGLPEDVDFKQLIEPLKALYKNEVRELGLYLGMPEEMVYRQPFPGPGLGVRVVGEITRDKLKALKEADYIYREEIKDAGLSRSIWQYYAAILPVKAVGIKNGKRAYANAIALRAVNTEDAMTADVVELPYSLLNIISTRIVNEVEGVTRVVYDITQKPPGTIEWE